MTNSPETSQKKVKQFLALSKKDLMGILAKSPKILETIQNENQESRKKLDNLSKQPQIFISYARLDQTVVIKLYEKLVADKFRVWIDIKSLIPGEKWEFVIKKAIEQSEFFIICLSKNSVTRRGTIQKELRIALSILEGMLDSDIYLIPARLEECEVPAALTNLQWVDLFKGDGYEKLIRAIYEGMKRRA